MYSSHEPIRGKYLVQMEAQIAEEIAQREARRREAKESRISLKRQSQFALKWLLQARNSFFRSKTDRLVSNDVVAIQPKFMG